MGRISGLVSGRMPYVNTLSNKLVEDWQQDRAYLRNLQRLKR